MSVRTAFGEERGDCLLAGALEAREEFSGEQWFHEAFSGAGRRPVRVAAQA